MTRRHVLTLVAASCVGAAVRAGGQAIDGSIRYVVGASMHASVRGEGFYATLWAADRPSIPMPYGHAGIRGYHFQMKNRETRDEFVKMLRSVLSGKGRMTLELDSRGREIKSLQLEVAA